MVQIIFLFRDLNALFWKTKFEHNGRRWKEPMPKWGSKRRACFLDYYYFATVD
jgi:hypothetical protein